MEHTPGPWKYEFYRNGPIWGYDITNEEKLITRIPGGAIWEDEPNPQDEINARLIAVAPELLVACADLVNACDTQMATAGVIGEVLTAVEQARAIIIKLMEDDNA